MHNNNMNNMNNLHNINNINNNNNIHVLHNNTHLQKQENNKIVKNSNSRPLSPVAS